MTLNTVKQWKNLSLHVSWQITAHRQGENLYILESRGAYALLVMIKYTGCKRRNGPDFGRVFLMLNYTEKPQNTYIQS